MWCPSCRADVAAELSLDNRRFHCARCQSELGIAASVAQPAPPSNRSLEMERDARDLLARWSAQSLLDTPGKSGAPGSTARSAEQPQAKIERTDGPQILPPSPSAAFMAAWKQPAISLPIERPEASTRAHEPKAVEDPQPKVEVRVPVQSETPVMATPESIPEVVEHHHSDHHVHDYKAPKITLHPHWTALLGQLTAYSGAALLSCGSALGMWSYFGGPATYLATGWLAAAIGQLLLMLGVVTLISNGLDQTIKEVSWRIDHLAEEVHHMGLALDDLEHAQHTAQLDLSRPQRDKLDRGPSREAA